MRHIRSLSLALAARCFDLYSTHSPQCNHPRSATPVRPADPALLQLPEPCYSLVVKKSARRPLVTASCILPHLGVQITPDMHVPGGMQAACQVRAHFAAV